MKPIEERNADFLEKLAIGLLVGAFVGAVPVAGRVFLLFGGVLCYPLMVLLTTRSLNKENGHGERS